MKKIFLLLPVLCIQLNAQITFAPASGWSLLGNAGTNQNTNFLGTTDDKELSFRINNLRSGYIDNDSGKCFFGYQAGILNRDGYDNTYFGWASGANNVSAVGNTGVGVKTLRVNTQNYNTALGAGCLEENTTGSENTAIGAYSQINMVDGSGNTTVGRYALANSPHGDYNVAIGWRSLYGANTTSTENTAVGGYGTLFSCSSGDLNTAVGSQAGFNNNGDGNTFLGYKAGFEWTISNNQLAISAGTNHFLIVGDGNAGSIGIGTGPSLADPTAMLDVVSTTKGVVFPRMTTTQKNAITPIEGLIVYDLTLHLYQFYNGTTWVTF